MTQLTDSPAWQALQQHFAEIKNVHMKDLFAQDGQRFERLSLKLNDILFDYSKNRVNDETLRLLIELAQQCGVEHWRDRMFAGELINHTEGRAVQHCALRYQGDQPQYANGERIDLEIKQELQQVKDLAQRIRRREWRGHNNQPITDVVNIGIGGSHLGPLMVTEALHPYTIHDLETHYVSNID